MKLYPPDKCEDYDMSENAMKCEVKAYEVESLMFTYSLDGILKALLGHRRLIFFSIKAIKSLYRKGSQRS